MLWTLLKLIGFLPLILIIIPVLRVLEGFLRYQFSKSTFSQIWRHPCTAPAIVEMVSHTGDVEDCWKKMKNPDGTVPSVSNWGPYVNGQPFIMVSEREALKDILSSKTGYPKYAPSYSLIADFLGQGLATSSGQVWASERRIIQPFFHLQSLKNLHESMVECTEQFMNEVSKQNEFVYAKDFFSSHTCKVITKLAFGNELDPEIVGKQLKEVNLAFNYHFVGKMIFGRLWSLFPYYGTILRTLKSDWKKQLNPILQKRRQMADSLPKEQKDLLSHLSLAKGDDDTDIPADLIFDECVTFLFAGTDTTASTLSWIMYYLTLYPDVQKKIQNEVDTLLKGRTPTYNELGELKYCHHVISETLRIQPVVPVLDRQAAEDITVAGVKLPKGTAIGIGIYTVQHDPNNWKDPETFIPERWEGLERDAFSWIPFSAGHRNCIGSKFAENEMLLAMAMIFSKFNVIKNNDKKVVPIFEGVLTPNNLQIKFTPRK